MNAPGAWNVADVRQDSTATRRRPYWLIGSVLLAGVLLLLAAAFLLDRRFRPDFGIEAPPATAGVVATAAPSGSGSQAATASITIPWQPIAKTPLEREVEEAYAQYWEVRVQGYFSLDSSSFGEIMAEEELRHEERQVQELKAQGRAGKLDVEHHIALLNVSADQAEVYDQYLNRSVFLDASTKQELPTAAPPIVEKVSFQLAKVDGKWKVVNGFVPD